MTECPMVRPSRLDATPDAAELAGIDAAIGEHETWKAAGRPGGTITHEQAVASLFANRMPLTLTTDLTQSSC